MGSALPYLISVDSSTDRSADNYEYTITFSAEQLQQALAGLGISADLAAPEGWFGPGSADKRRIHKNRHGLRADPFPARPCAGAGPAQHMLYGTVPEREFQLYHPGLRPRRGLSQWGTKAMAEQGKSYADILAHYYPGTQLQG